MAFGKRVGGGRRTDKREIAPLSAHLSTFSETFRTVVVDLSATGARVQGGNLPREGEELYFVVGSLRTVATVKWRREMECGVQFVEPLLQTQVKGIRREVARSAGLPPEMAAALNDWVLGIAR